MTRTFALATAPRLGSKEWPQRPSLTWPSLVNWLDLQNPSDHKECGGYVLGKLQNARRTKDTVVSRCAIVLDADTASATFVTDSAAALGCAAVFHTTWSHTLGNPRWRVILPLSRDVTPSEYRRIVAALMEHLGVEQFDDGSLQPERLMLKPSSRPDGAYESHVVEGEFLDADEWLARSTNPSEATELGSAGDPGASDERLTDEGVASSGPLHPYAETAIASELARLDVLASEGWFQGAGWDLTCFEVACNLIEFANSYWSGYSLEQAQADFFDRAPADSEWGHAKHREKWDSALAKVGGNGRAEPEGSAAEVFGDLPLTETAVAVSAPAQDFADAVQRAAQRLRVDDAARALVAAERQIDLRLPLPVDLSAFLSEPDVDVPFRVQDMWPTGGRALLVAQHKAGKTTLAGNLIRSLVDGEAFLDKFDVAQAGRVLLIDNELDPRMLRRWLRDHNINNTDNVGVISLRGHLSKFNVLDPIVRTKWATALGPSDVLIFDCLRPALDALGLSEDKDAGRFLEAMDELTAEAGIDELAVIHHMGHANERSRGDSRILDWPDAVWRLVKGTEQLGYSPRYLSAYGRDVDQPEMRLNYDSASRRLTIVGGSRVEFAAVQFEDDVLLFVENNPGCSQTAIEAGVGGDRNVVRSTVHRMRDDGRLRSEKLRNATCHWVTNQ